MTTHDKLSKKKEYRCVFEVVCGGVVCGIW